MAGRHRAPKEPSTLTRKAMLVGIVASSAAAGTVMSGPSAAAAQAPATITFVPASASTPVTTSTYTVVAGDWLSKIAPRYGMTTSDLYASNRTVVGANPNLIFPGQKLDVGKHAAPAQHAAPFASPLHVMDVTQGFKGAAHRGIDLHADIGTPGYAVATGTVHYSRPASGFGLWTVIRSYIDGQTVDFVYGHMNHLVVAEGDHVQVGQHVIDTGTNGVVTGPHLHFEVWIGGRDSGYAVDPVTWLRAHGVNA